MLFVLVAGLVAAQPARAWADDPVVPDLIRAAVGYHPSLRGQQGRKDASASDVEAAKWQFWPTPSVSVESAKASQGDPSYAGDKTVTYMRLQQPLWTGGRLSGGLSRAKAREIAAASEFIDVKQQLGLKVVQAWSDALVASLRVKAFQDSRDMHVRLLQLVERRTGEGASADADVALASSRLDSVKADLEGATAQLQNALQRLRLLTGEAVTAEKISRNAGYSLPMRDAQLDALLTAARAVSPQLAKGRAQVAAAEADVQIARAALWPDVYLRLERQNGNFLQNQVPPQNRVFVGVTTSLGGGLSNLSAIDSAMAQQRAAMEDLQTQQLVVDEQVQSDHILATTAQIRRAGLDNARRAAADVLSSYERQFLAGRKQWLDLMNAAREQAQTDSQLADAVGAEQLANWRLAIYSRGIDSVLSDGVKMAAIRGRP